MVGLGAFAVPAFQPALLNGGLRVTDWIASAWFRRGHMATTFTDTDLVSPDRFPLNSYADDDTGIDLDAWRLRVDGLVARPGEYTLPQIQALPRASASTLASTGTRRSRGSRSSCLSGSRM